MAHIVHGTLTANQVATVSLDEPYELVEVLNRNGAGEIYFRLDGTDPVIGADDCYVVPATIWTTEAAGILTAPTTVLLISDAACTYSVTGT